MKSAAGAILPSSSTIWRSSVAISCGVTGIPGPDALQPVDHNFFAGLPSRSARCVCRPPAGPVPRPDMPPCWSAVSVSTNFCAWSVPMARSSTSSAGCRSLKGMRMRANKPGTIRPSSLGKPRATECCPCSGPAGCRTTRYSPGVRKSVSSASCSSTGILPPSVVAQLFGTAPVR